MSYDIHPCVDPNIPSQNGLHKVHVQKCCMCNRDLQNKRGGIRVGMCSFCNTSGFSATFAYQVYFLHKHAPQMDVIQRYSETLKVPLNVRRRIVYTEDHPNHQPFLQTLLASWMTISRIMFAGIFASLLSPTSPESNLKQHSVMDGYAPVDFGRRSKKWSPVHQIKDKYPWFAFRRKVLFYACLVHPRRSALHSNCSQSESESPYPRRWRMGLALQQFSSHMS